MRTYFMFLLILISSVVQAQFSYPAIKSKGNRIDEFIPSNWTILDSANGDLNKDKLIDAAIVLQYKDSLPIVNPDNDTTLAQPRILIILFSDSSGSLTLVEQSNTFIINNDNPMSTDPYEDILIDKGVLEIRFQLLYGDVTNLAYKFRFQQGEFALIGADKFITTRATLDFANYSYNFLTKKRSLVTGNEDKGTKNKTIWKSIHLTQLKTLKTFKQPITWEVEKFTYL